MPDTASPFIDRSLRFGSHLFVNPEDTPDTLRPRLAELARAGFTLVRLFMTWHQLEPRPGEHRWSPFDEIFDEADRLGMKIVPTLMAVSPPGWMRLTNGMQEVADLDDPEFFSKALDHVRTVVSRYRSHPALDSWILWNEPGRRPDPASPRVRAAFQSYLENEYNTPSALSAVSYQPVASFATVSPPPAAQEGFVSHHGRVDWLRFCVDNLRHHLSHIAAAVRALDPRHPVHVNPHRIAQFLAEDGQSIWREADLVDFMGCSAHPAWHSVRFPRHRYGDSVALFADLVRSATRDPEGHFWVTELQGGTTLMSAFEPLHASPGESREWLCQGVAAGAKAIVYWCANARTDGYEAGEWDLLDMHGKPTPQLDAIADTLRHLAPRLPDLSRARPPCADLAIIVSEPSGVLDHADGTGDDPADPRNRNKTADAVAGAYLLAADLSLEVRFLDLARLAETPLDRLPPVLVLPGAVVLDQATLDKLAAAVRSGRLVVGDGLCAWKTAHGRLANDLWPAADRLWGATCSHYGALPGSASIATTDGTSLPAWFLRARLHPEASTETLARWTDDNSPAVVLRSVGDGAACRIGTVFFQRYLTDSSPAARDWFSRLVADLLPAGVPRLVAPVPGLRLRRLRLDDRPLVLLLNRTDTPLAAEILWNNVSSGPLVVPPRDLSILDAENLRSPSRG